METFHWKDYWNALRVSLRKAHPELTEQDLAYREGDESQLMQRLSSRLSKSPAQLNELLFVHLIAMPDEEETGEGMDPDALLEELEREMKDSSPRSN